MPLNPRPSLRAAAAIRGFSLIEMMIAITIGLIVVAGATTLIVAINQSNSDMIQSTRLTQELRALAAVIANDVKRARRLDDPLAKVGQGAPCVVGEPCYAITPAYAAPPAAAAEAACITYGYTGTIGSRAANNYLAIGHRPGSPGRVMLYQQAAGPFAGCPATDGTVLNSPQIDITNLTFTRVAPGQVDLRISGRLRTGSASMSGITRTFVQPIFIRSGPAN